MTILREAAVQTGVTVIDGGTYVCTNGPALRPRAQIAMYRNAGATPVGMTGYPEVALARELDLPYASVGVVSNAAAGANEEPLGLDDIRAVMASTGPQVRLLLAATAARLA
ncbi:MAG: hypothetical protein CM1200mP26_26380 [Acidimicrobiales bacterium]|nr:MAG: hypothetical protein CM1200mP26_26380 [Acidimicrobiales bacterium]